jgi:hypothetical protein
MAIILNEEMAARWSWLGSRPPDECVIERVIRSQSAASAAFNVALGRIAADVLAESGR